MSKILDSKSFGKKLYDTLPALYHSADSMVDYSLKRYLQALSDGGFAHVVNELNGILDLNDPNKTPMEVLNVLFEQYGLPLFNGIPEMYLRKLLPILGDLYSRKGATTTIEFLTSIISDVKSEVIVSPNFLEDYHIDLKLEMDYDQAGARDLPDKEQLLRIIEEFLPFYIEVTVIYMYLFYETGNVKVTEDEDFYSLEVTNEDTRLVRQKGEGLFPVLNNLNVGMNKDLVLNDTYYFDEDIDCFTDSIVQAILEKASITSEKSEEYLRPSLNNEFKLLNKGLVLNEAVDTDELVSTLVKVYPKEDIAEVKTVEVITDTLKSSFEDKSKISQIDSYSQTKVIDNTKEKGDINSDIQLVDTITLLEESTIKSDYEEEEHLFIGDRRFYASLNTGFLLNKDLITNESLADIGILQEEEKQKEILAYKTTETGVLTNELTGVDAFLNKEVCVLNTMLLNNISEYVKITINGKTEVKYPTIVGLM